MIRVYVLLIVILYALCASSFTICKAVLQYSKPFFFIGMRMVVAGTLLLAFYAWHHKKFPTIYRKDSWLFIQIILFHIYFAYVLDLWSLQYITSFKSSFFFNLAPFITALFSYRFFNERMNIKKWLGLGISFLGFIPELAQHIPAEDALGGIFFLSWPDIAMIGAVTSSCYGWIIMRQIVKDQGYSPFMVNGIGMLGGGLMALLTSYVMEDYWRISPVSNIGAFLALTALIIIVVNGIFYNFYGYLLRQYTATFLSFAGFMCPLFVALFGALFLHEQVTWQFFFSSLVVLCGLYIFYQEELRQGYINTSASGE